MRFKLMLPALLFMFVFTSFNTPITEVFVCKGRTIGKFHYSKACRGLVSCKHEIVKLDLQDATAEGYTVCLWEK